LSCHVVKSFGGVLMLTRQETPILGASLSLSPGNLYNGTQPQREKLLLGEEIQNLSPTFPQNPTVL
jgi:hypothetical protein